jgi:hypothetical protein
MKKEMGGACGTYGGERNVFSILVWKLNERDCGVDGRIILKCMLGWM